MTVYTPIRKEDLEKRIQDAKKDSLENRILITLRSIQVYSAAVFKLGKNSNTPREALYARKEFIGVLKEERNLFKFLIENIHLIDIEAASKVIDSLDEVKDETIRYYREILNNIEDAAMEHDEKLARRAKKDFYTLTETRDYREEVVALTENQDTVKAFLNLPDEFWDYISTRCKSIEMAHEIADGMTFVRPIFDKEGNIADLRMAVPKPNDLYTALLAIQSYIRAYNIFIAIGKPTFLKDEYTINQAKMNYRNVMYQKARRLIKKNR